MAEIENVGRAPASRAAQILARALAPPAGRLPLRPADANLLAAPRPVRVITFNTAVGNGKIKTPQAAFADLPFYRDIVEGHPDAAILCAQEVGPAQLDRLKALSKNGNFQVIATYAHPGQANMVLVPKRFEVVEAAHKTFVGSHLRGVWNALKGWITGKTKLHWSQMFEPRKYTEIALRDRESGRTFTLFNTHLSYYGPVLTEQAGQLFGAVHGARARGPVILAGDLNSRTAENDPGDSPHHAQVRSLFGPLRDMGPPGPAGSRPNIDYVLADGFSAAHSRLYTGKSLQLPGFPNAELVSDHYAEEDTLRFD